MPQQSTRGFVSPSSAPIRKTPNITDIIGENEKRKNGEEEKGERNVRATFTVAHCNETFTVVQSNDDEMINLRESVPSACQKNFPGSWHEMFNHVFASVPTIHIPLKNTLPEMENNIIKVMVKNEIQKEHFEAKTREVLEYLRTHFDEQVENIVVVANEQMETKKIIYDIKDKLQNFKEQNAEFDDFLQILDLKIKD
jgi:hypothetical protein